MIVIPYCFKKTDARYDQNVYLLESPDAPAQMVYSERASCGDSHNYRVGDLVQMHQVWTVVAVHTWRSWLQTPEPDFMRVWRNPNAHEIVSSVDANSWNLTSA